MRYLLTTGMPLSSVTQAGLASKPRQHWRREAPLSVSTTLSEDNPVTADFVYVRLHGPEGAYQGRYSDATLADWAEAFLSWASQGKEVYCYFDNDEKGYAAQNALELKNLVEEC